MENTDTFLKFITGQEIIMVRDVREFTDFRKMLRRHKVDTIFGNTPGSTTYEYWRHKASMALKGRRLEKFGFRYKKGMTLIPISCSR